MLSISSSSAALLFLAAPTWPEPAARHVKEHGSDSRITAFPQRVQFCGAYCSSHAFNPRFQRQLFGGAPCRHLRLFGYCSTRRLASSATDMNRLMPPSGGPFNRLLRQPAMSALGQSATSVRRSQMSVLGVTSDIRLVDDGSRLTASY